MGNVVSRREFLKLTGGVAAGAAAIPGTAHAATPAGAGRATLPYPSKAIGKAGATNAAMLAVAILANTRPELRARLRKFRVRQTETVLNDKLPL